VKKRLINDYATLSLEFAYAGNMWKNMPHICSTYVPHILPNSAYFASKSSTYFKKILRYKPTSLIHSNTYYVGYQTQRRDPESILTFRAAPNVVLALFVSIQKVDKMVYS